MMLRIIGVAVVLTACGARSPARPSGSSSPAWHVVLHETPYAGHYLVNITLVPPDGSEAVQLAELASRAPCFTGMETRFCVRAPGARADHEWGVTCGDTRMHVVLDSRSDQLAVGRSDATTEFCTITRQQQALPARGAVAIAAIPWGLADGGMHPSP